jgi:hypothetical protein
MSFLRFTHVSSNRACRQIGARGRLQNLHGVHGQNDTCLQSERRAGGGPVSEYRAKSDRPLVWYVGCNQCW